MLKDRHDFLLKFYCEGNTDEPKGINHMKPAYVLEF